MPEKYFIVVDGDLRLKMHKGPSGMYVAVSLDVSGLFTQGHTVEDAIANAHDAAKALAESRAIMAKEISAAARAAKMTAAVKPAKAIRERRRLVKA